MAEDGYAGFPREAARFLKDLTQNNSKAWFDTRRGDYQAGMAEPAKDFVIAMGTRLARIDPGIRAEPKVNGSIFRINRDTRFSKDKSPYKDHLALIFWRGEGRNRECPGYYFRLSAESLGLAAGLYQMTDSKLARYRSAVLDAAEGSELTKLLAKLQKGGNQIGGEKFKRVPRGLPADHANAELLKHKGLYAWVDTAPLPDLTGDAFADFCFDHFRRMAPLEAWLYRNLEG